MERGEKNRELKLISIKTNQDEGPGFGPWDGYLWGYREEEGVRRYGSQKALDMNPFLEPPFPALQNSFKYSVR